MLAAQLDFYGGRESVIVRDVTIPSVDKGKMLVSVKAAGINPIDWKVREGYLRQHLPLDLPITMGGDFSGTFVEEGESGTVFKKGEEVWGTASVLNGGSGALAELALASTLAVSSKPRSIDHINAASLPLVGVSALQALLEHMNICDGQRILIQGGAGGIGSVAVQIASNVGAYVIATASERDSEYVHSLGADEVHTYESDDFDDVYSGLDLVYDTVGGEVYGRSFRVLKKGGTIVTTVERSDDSLMREYGVFSVTEATEINRGRLLKLADMVDKGIVKPHLDRTYDLEFASDAIEYQRKGTNRGKIVVIMK